MDTASAGGAGLGADGGGGEDYYYLVFEVMQTDVEAPPDATSAGEVVVAGEIVRSWLIAKTLRISVRVHPHVQRARGVTDISLSKCENVHAVDA